MLLVSNCLTSVCGDVCAEPPETAPIGLLVGVVFQVKVVPAGIILPLPLVGKLVKLLPLHIDSVCGVTDGFGFTVTFTVKGSPTQLP